MGNIFDTPANVRTQLMGHALLETELPRECPELGTFGGFDLPDTLGLAGSIDTESDFQRICDMLHDMREDEVVILPLPGDVDFYLVIYGTNPAEA